MSNDSTGTACPACHKVIADLEDHHGWCVEGLRAVAALGDEPSTDRRPCRIGFDVGGVLSKYPDTLRPLFFALASSPFVEVHVVTDMPHAKAVDMLRRNGFNIAPERVHACDYDGHGEGCKAAKAREIGLDVLIDDFGGYVSIPGAPVVRLLVQPDASRPYYADTWETDGDEGTFGRRRFTAP